MYPSRGPVLPKGYGKTRRHGAGTPKGYIRSPHGLAIRNASLRLPPAPSYPLHSPAKPLSPPPSLSFRHLALVPLLSNAPPSSLWSNSRRYSAEFPSRSIRHTPLSNDFLQKKILPNLHIPFFCTIFAQNFSIVV